MTTLTKYLTGTYNSGYSLQAAITTLRIGSTAVVNGKQKGSAVYTAYGTTRTGALAIMNYGRLEGGENVVDYGIGNSTYPVVDGAPTSGIYIRSSASVTITNGRVDDAAAQIFGYGAGINVGGHAALVTNYSTVSAAVGSHTRTTHFLDDAAVMLLNGGTVVNGAVSDHLAVLMGGFRGVVVNGGAGTLTNFGAIEMTDLSGETSYPGSMGVVFTDGGVVTNGATADTAAFIRGGVGVYISGAAGTLTNFGEVSGQAAGGLGVNHPGAGVVLLNGGKVINGSTSASGALIEGAIDGVVAGTAAVFNYGQIIGSAAYGNGAGVTLTSGAVVNGGARDRQARIEGYQGVVASAGGGVTNFGAITGQYIGVDMQAGGVLTNAAGGVITGDFGVVGAGNVTVSNAGAIDSFAAPAVKFNGGGAITNASSGVIDGYEGIDCATAVTIENLGQILTSGGPGVALRNGGTLINGLVIGEAAVIRGADIYGAGPEVMANGGASVTNLSAIDGYGGVAVEVSAGSTLANGSKYDSFAEIQGISGVYLSANSTATNFGTILGSREDGVGVSAAGYSAVVNNKGALISGFAGVDLANHATLIDYGQITGSGGTAVSVGATDELVIGAGASFTGSVTGARGELGLARGAATLALPSNGGVVVSGLIATTTTFSNFAAVDVSSASTTTLSGTGAVVSGETLSVEGNLLVGGRLNLLSGSRLTVAGALSGGGTVNVGFGATATFASGAELDLGNVILASATSSVSDSAPSLTFNGLWTQTQGTLSVASGDVLTFTGAGDTFKGTLAGGGLVVLGGGSDTLNNLTVDTFVTITGAGTVTATGAITMDDNFDLESGTLVVGAGTGGATFTGQTLELGDSSLVTGASASSTFTNNAITLGAGQLGDGHMRLVNETGGAIGAESSTAALVINTGTVAIVNDGQLDSYDAGGMIIESKLTNAGLLFADGGDIIAQKAVTGAGSVEINSATADFASTFTQNVDFVTAFFMPPASGTLELARSQTYTGTISGFTINGATALDLRDIKFAGGITTATYSGTTASGVLTVSDGTHTAHINLAGDYTASGWLVSSDGHGGTTIADPAKAAATPPPHTLPFIIAMAGFGDGAGPALTISHDAGRLESTLLTRPA